MCGEDPEADGLLLGEPRHAAPPRRHHPVDQRRHAAPVDHARRRGHRLPAGRQRQQRPRHARSGPRRADLLLHQPAERAADVLPRPCVGHHPAQRVRRRGRGLRAHRRDRADPDRPRRRPRRPRRRHAARHPGQDLRPGQHRPDRPDLGQQPLGRHGQPVDAARLHARAEPGPTHSGRARSDAGCTARGSGRRPRTPSTRRSPTRTTTWTRRRASRRRSSKPCDLADPATWQYQTDPSASRRRSRPRRTSRSAWRRSTTRRSSTARPTRRPRSTRRPTATGSSTRRTTASGTSSGTSPTRRPAR